MSLGVPELSSSMSSLMPATMRPDDVTNNSTMATATEKALNDFAEMKIATLIDRIYVPIVFSVGLVFNSLCFVTFVFTSLRNTSTCVYMAAIAVLDSVVLVHAFCIMVRRYVGDTVFYMGSSWACGFHIFLFYFALHFDVLVLLSMTVDRFIVVKFPLKAQSWCTPKSALGVITGVGTFSFALNIQIFFNRRLVPTGNVQAPLRCWYPAGSDVEFFMEKIYSVIDASIYSFIPFVSLLTLNFLIIKQLNQARKFSKQFTGNRDTNVPFKGRSADMKTENVSGTGGGRTDSNRDGGSGTAKKSATGTNISVMFLLVSFTFLLLTSPIVIVLWSGRDQAKTNAQQARFLLTLVCVEKFMYSNHAINFLLYCISGRRFRQELGRLLARFCCRS